MEVVPVPPPVESEVSKLVADLATRRSSLTGVMVIEVGENGATSWNLAAVDGAHVRILFGAAASAVTRLAVQLETPPAPVVKKKR